MSESDLITVKELAAELEITDLVLKKLIKFFEIPNQKVKRNIHLSDEAVITIKRVMELKAEGKRNKDIKQLFDEERKKEKKALETLKKTEENTNIPEDTLDLSLAATSNSDLEIDAVNSDILSDEEDNSEKLSGESADLGFDRNSDADLDDEDDEEYRKEEEPAYIKAFIEAEEIEAKFDVEQEDVLAEALALDATAEEEGGDLDPVELTDESEELSKDSLSPRKIRRKAFSFRYIQREIANDTKALNFIKNKLKKGKLSHVERLNLLDSLDRRAKMLNSWIQILRWVKS